MLKKIIDGFNRLRAGEDLARAAGDYWGLSGTEGRVQDQSHWCGVRRWNRERWTEYGDFHLTLIQGYLARFAAPDYIGSLTSRTALDWGCGGGSVARVLCRTFSRVYGVDISEATLSECAGQMQRCGLSNFRGILSPSQDPESVLRGLGAGSVDFVFSVNVFQHFPSKPYARRVLGVMAELLKPEGFALLQVRYFDGSEKLRQKDEDYARNVIYMTSLTPEEFSGFLEEAGFAVLQRERDLDGRKECHDYYFVRKEPVRPS